MYALVCFLLYLGCLQSALASTVFLSKRTNPLEHQASFQDTYASEPHSSSFKSVPSTVRGEHPSELPPVQHPWEQRPIRFTEMYDSGTRRREELHNKRGPVGRLLLQPRLRYRDQMIRTLLLRNMRLGMRRWVGQGWEYYHAHRRAMQRTADTRHALAEQVHRPAGDFQKEMQGRVARMHGIRDKLDGHMTKLWPAAEILRQANRYPRLHSPKNTMLVQQTDDLANQWKQTRIREPGRL